MNNYIIMELESFPIFISHVLVDETSSNRHKSIVFWGQKRHENVATLESMLSGFSNLLKYSSAPLISQARNAHLLCVEVDGTWLRAKIDPSFTISSGLVDVCCVDYGFSCQVNLPFLQITLNMTLILIFFNFAGRYRFLP